MRFKYETAKSIGYPLLLLNGLEKKAHYSIDTAAKKIGVLPDQLKDWEREQEGSSQPSLTQAKKMSQVYRRSLATFYLPHPPKDFPLLKDFRTVAGKAPKYSPPLVFFMRHTQERQAWLSQHFREQGYSKLQFIGSLTVKSSVKNAAQNIINTIWGNAKEYSKIEDNAQTVEKLLIHWINQCEKKGIFISRASNLNSRNPIPVKEARGFVISDPYAPFIFINSKDSDNAKLFTLLHELAHLWLNIFWCTWSFF